MIRIVVGSPPLSPVEQYGLDVVVDLSRLLVVAEAGPGAEAANAVGIVSLMVGPPPAAGHAGAAVSLLAAAITVADGSVTVPRALLRAVADVAGAGIEQRSSGRDRYNRVPSADNPVVAAGVEREPVVSIAGARLREAVRQAAGSRILRLLAPWPDAHRWCAAMTHDVDVVSAWPLFTALRVAELVRKGRGRLAGTVLAAAARAAVGDPVGDPVWVGIRGVLDTERRYGVISTWFMLCGAPTLASLRAGDLTYRPESPRARRILAAIGTDAHEVGLHGSFATSEAPDVFASQRTRLRALSGTAPAGVRQHYLRIRPGATQRWMVEAGFAYDATYGFPDRNGFRLGVVDVVPAWDAAAQHALPLDEVPLVWMDRAQSKYQGVEDPDHWIADAMALADVSRRAEGLWVGLWHPNLTPALGFPEAPAAFERLVAALIVERPYIAPLHRIVEWRGLRRAVRTHGVGPDGTVTLVGPSGRAFDVVTEDADGHPRERLARTAAAPTGL
jgi:hypothetical protein